jgi:hypothetical protein
VLYLIFTCHIRNAINNKAEESIHKTSTGPINESPIQNNTEKSLNEHALKKVKDMRRMEKVHINCIDKRRHSNSIRKKFIDVDVKKSNGFFTIPKIGQPLNSPLFECKVQGKVINISVMEDVG